MFTAQTIPFPGEKQYAKNYDFNVSAFQRIRVWAKVHLQLKLFAVSQRTESKVSHTHTHARGYVHRQIYWSSRECSLLD